MINQTTKDKIEALRKQYISLSEGNETLLREITLTEIPEIVYNSNTIENSTLTLANTEKILLGGIIGRNIHVREIYETKNLATLTEIFIQKVTLS